jgi:hypothetical protein
VCAPARNPQPRCHLSRYAPLARLHSLSAPEYYNTTFPITAPFSQDKANPKDWSKPERLTVLPPEAEAMQQPLDRFKAFFSAESIASMFK